MIGTSFLVRNLAVQSQLGTVLQNTMNTSEGLLCNKWSNLSAIRIMESKKVCVSKQLLQGAHDTSFSILSRFDESLLYVRQYLMQVLCRDLLNTLDTQVSRDYSTRSLFLFN